ncbi:hypothetical protein [Teichococcus aestuarii]|uniref:hypothetical protein n=1 Tax=Teichococcus aestuarii TaxID=568898 RepID=UPI0036169557
MLAVGSRANDFGIPGVREHCHFIDSRNQAEDFNTALRTEVIRCRRRRTAPRSTSPSSARAPRGWS